MNFDKLTTYAVGGAIAVAMATTILGRSNTARVIDSAGGAFAGVISASLGKGIDLR